MRTFFPGLVCGMPCPGQSCGESSPGQGSAGFAPGCAHKPRVGSAFTAGIPQGCELGAINPQWWGQNQKISFLGFVRTPKCPLWGFLAEARSVETPELWQQLGQPSPAADPLGKRELEKFGKFRNWPLRRKTNHSAEMKWVDTEIIL